MTEMKLSERVASLKQRRDRLLDEAMYDWGANARLRDSMVALMYNNFDAVLAALRLAESAQVNTPLQFEIGAPITRRGKNVDVDGVFAGQIVWEGKAHPVMAIPQRRGCLLHFCAADQLFARMDEAELADGLDRIAGGAESPPPSVAEAVAAERERCAKIAEGEIVFECYRRWSCWNPHGDRSKEWEGTDLADSIAAAIKGE